MSLFDDIKEKTLEFTSDLYDDNPLTFATAPEFVKKAVVDADKDRAETVAAQITALNAAREQERKDFAAKVALLKYQITTGAKNIFTSSNRNDYKEYF